MNYMMSFDAWRLLLTFLVITSNAFGKPFSNNGRQDSKIIKRVEIYGGKNYKKDQPSFRRQSVIHAGNDYDTETGDSQPEPDELENLGKIIDYNGKIIDSAKSLGNKWKDTPGISKDVIERIKEIQDTLIKRTGTKDLAEKLKLMQPEKNVTISSSSTVPLNSRKVIPEDVVNKILAKFQELREQAKTLATLDKGAGKVDGKDKAENPKIIAEDAVTETHVKEDLSKQSSSNEVSTKEASSKESKDAGKVEVEHGRPKSPYASIGPAKDNEELRNISQPGVTEVLPDRSQANEDRVKASGPPVAEAPGEENEPEQMNQQIAPKPEKMEGGQMNTPANMMMGGKVPMMFIKQGEMLVPVYGNQDGTNQQYQRSAGPMTGTPSMAPNMGFVPQPSATQVGQSRSGPASAQVQIPSVPLSTIMSIMGGPNMISNLPASPMTPPQMNGGIYNVPQNPMMNQAGFLQQYRTGVINNQPNGGVTGTARQMLPPQGPPNGGDFMNALQEASSLLGGQGVPFQGPGPTFPMQGPQEQSMPFQGQSSPFQSQLSKFQSQFSPFQEQGSPFEEKSPQPIAGFAGGFPGQSEAMGGSARGAGFGLAMDQAGQLSPVSPMNSGVMPPQPMGPISENPFQDTHPEARNNMEVLDKEKQMLNPYMTNSVNDLSDPMPGEDVQANTRNLNPDALLELAKFRKTDPDQGSENTETNPDNLLDTLKQGQLSRELTGPGDPERIGVNGMMSPPPASPFAGTNPETLLDMLSKRNSKQIWNKGTMELERSAQNQLMENQRMDAQGLRRGGITQIGTNGMQGISSLPAFGRGGIDPSLADYTTNMIGNQPVDVTPKSSALNNPVENSLFMAAQVPRYRKETRPNKIDVLSHDTLRFQHSKNAIDSGEDTDPVNRADVFARHRIMNPDFTAIKRSMKPSTLHHDNVELRVNGKPLAEKGSLRSKIVDGKIKKGQGKTLTSKSPVKIELSHADDAKKTKIINIVTTGKYQVTDSKRNKVVKNDKFIKSFYKRT